MPWPGRVSGDDEEDDAEEGLLPSAARILHWCAACGLRVEPGAGYACRCEKPHPRTIQIVHRQCEMDPEDRRKTEVNLRRRRLMRECPNCHYKRVSVEPVQRYREWRDEMGAAMAIPLTYFQMRPTEERKASKLLCFTDNRQRAAAFPTMLEERTFPNDFGRALLSALRERGPMAIDDLGQELEVLAADEKNRLFLPPARLPDGAADARIVRRAWDAEVMAHFASMDAAGRTPEDLGLLTVRYDLDTDWREGPRRRLAAHGLDAAEADDVVQVLLSFLRRDKAIVLPAGVDPDAPAFGSIPWKFVYAFTTGEKREGLTVKGWMRAPERLKRYGHTPVGDYLSRMLDVSDEDVFDVARGVWDDLCDAHVLVRLNVGDFYQLDHEMLTASLVPPGSRFVCDRCQTVTSLAPCAVCPRLRCKGTLRARDWALGEQTLVARWVSGDDQRFASVRVAEHTAQIAKSNAEQIERDFRAEDSAGRAGVDVLSSTTTFEMGINIGDLQTVLLRNAPRSSANYVQRIGRAGRGRDKNAICVTLCDRTPYAIDVWQKPELIMGGEVRAPTVFLANALIAQRHFNAYLFAEFLRQRILVEKVIAKPNQSLEVANFLRKNGLSFAFPDWLPEQRSKVILDFSAWLDDRRRGEQAFRRGPMRTIVDAIGDEDLALQAARDGFDATVGRDRRRNRRLHGQAAGERRRRQVDRQPRADGQEHPARECHRPDGPGRLPAALRLPTRCRRPRDRGLAVDSKRRRTAARPGVAIVEIRAGPDGHREQEVVQERGPLHRHRPRPAQADVLRPLPRLHQGRRPPGQAGIRGRPAGLRLWPGRGEPAPIHRASSLQRRTRLAQGRSVHSLPPRHERSPVPVVGLVHRRHPRRRVRASRDPSTSASKPTVTCSARTPARGARASPSAHCAAGACPNPRCPRRSAVSIRHCGRGAPRSEPARAALASATPRSAIASRACASASGRSAPSTTAWRSRWRRRCSAASARSWAST